ncbi:hypothetical protein [Streptomyces sp. NPDC059278]|uniref:hypothetical protein n=1 Tax=Streptomyces sp. NPDC059278 TaxID=3346801 RepID=UPI0036C4F1CA
MLHIESEASEELMRFTRQTVAEAMKSGIDPLGNRAVPVIDGPVHRFAGVFERSPGVGFREWMAKQFEEAHDPRGGSVLAAGVDRQRSAGSAEPGPGLPLARPGAAKRRGV